MIPIRFIVVIEVRIHKARWGIQYICIEQVTTQIQRMSFKANNESLIRLPTMALFTSNGTSMISLE